MAHSDKRADEESPGAITAQSSLGAVARFAAGTVGLCLAVAATATALIVGVRDGNDYALATRLKHDRLEAIEGEKLVFVGGSNLSFGLDSQWIEQHSGRHVVNMGMNGYFGVRYMLEEVRPELDAGDTVVLSFEYDSFVKSVEGTPADLLMVVKARPAAFAALSWRQRLGLLGPAPYVAQQKALRLVRDGLDGAKGLALAALGRSEAPPVLYGRDAYFALLYSVESAAGFNVWGDLTSHHGVSWPYGLEDGFDLTTMTHDEDIYTLIADFARDMRARGVPVVWSYPPASASYFTKHAAAIERIHTRMKAIVDLEVPSPPQAFMFPDERFFDTVYHLEQEGARERSARIVGDLLNADARNTRLTAHP